MSSRPIWFPGNLVKLISPDLPDHPAFFLLVLTVKQDINSNAPWRIITAITEQGKLVTQYQYEEKEPDSLTGWKIVYYDSNPIPR